MEQVRTPKVKPKQVTRAEPISPDAYRALVRRVMQDAISGEAGSDRVFSNSGAEHAKIVLETMLENAHEHVDIFSHQLGRSVWQPHWFNNLLHRSPDIRIRILVDADGEISGPTSALSSLWHTNQSNNFIVHRCNHAASGPHVTIVDDQHVRLERDHELMQAAVAFGASDLGQAASRMFENLWLMSEPVR